MKTLRLTSIICLLALATGFASCSDDKDPLPTSGVMTLAQGQSHDFTFSDELGTEVDLRFTTRMVWRAEVPKDAAWLTVSPNEGAGGTHNVTISASHYSGDAPRTATVTFTCGAQVEEFTVTQLPSESDELTPANIPDYEKFFNNSEHGGDKMLNSESKFSFYRYKQSEHFFVFWDKYFGDDPNSTDLAAADRVDVDDLLEKAEHFFQTNIVKLGMADLGQGKSVLDDYKMQIYLLDPTPESWVATGSGYDDMIGALWITPATCQPVGSTIAHEIGHSFQYQTYADRVEKQGARNDHSTGFRYGFVGPDGSGNGGCGYWEQCAQWQSYQDYPEEQFTSYNYAEWINNHFRHFHHEWQRYASYWLQSYWVEKHGIQLYGRIWKESKQPEDAIMAYTRLYNGDNYQLTREELYDYAARMATYDIEYNHVKEYGAGYQDRYRENLIYDKDNGRYQIAYSSCPGATGFNVISLNVPANGGTVSVDFQGLEYGAPLLAADPGVYKDNESSGTTRNYNAVGGAENMGWRYGLVALSGDKRTYSEVGKDKNGSVSMNVPAGADYLFLVVQGSPEAYMSHGWDEQEQNDPQFPYAFKVNGTSLKWYEEAVEASYTKVDDNMLKVDYPISISVDLQDWAIGEINLGEQPVLDFLGLTSDQLADAFLTLPSGQTVEPAEGKVVLGNLQSDGTYSFTGSSNNGFWCDKNGDRVSWGNGTAIYSERGNGKSLILTYGQMAGSFAKGEVVHLRPAMIYVKGGVKKTVQYDFTYTYK